MPDINWKRMLTRWSRAMIAAGTSVDLPGATGEFVAATDGAIAATEKRLGLTLPPSYRSFLKVNNGWWLDGTAGPIRLLPVEQIGRMADLQPEAAAIWSSGHEMFPEMMELWPEVKENGEEGSALDFPPAHYQSAMQISEDNDGCFLLNANIEPDAGEWQAAFHANWVPGAQCFPSFAAMMQEKFEAFITAHGAGSDPGPVRTSKRPLNLAKPPKRMIEDPAEFVAELKRLNFFQFAAPGAEERMIANYFSTWEAFKRNKYQLLSGEYASPGAALLGPESKRVVDLDESELATARGRYALEQIRPLLSAFGIEFGSIEEAISEKAYAVSLEGITHEFFRLRRGRPATLGGEHLVNAARLVIYESAKLLNKVLRQRGCLERVATLEEMQEQFEPRMRFALVVLNDELSYLFMWSGAVLGDCYPLRPDVL